MFKQILGIAAATVLGAGAANAVTFATTGNTNTYGTVTDATSSHSYTVTDGGQTYSMKATAYSWTGSSAETAFLGQYSYGLGVTSSSDGYGSNNEHTVDNHGSLDFIALQFDRPVDLVSASLYAGFAIGGTPDNDASISYATVGNAWNSKLNINDPALLATLTGNMYTVAGTGKADAKGSWVSNLNSSDHVGNLWIIGAAFDNPDCTYDSFKLNTITVKTAGAVPEPATWATMIAGFGLVGGTLRQRKRAALPALA